MSKLDVTKVMEIEINRWETVNYIASRESLEPITQKSYSRVAQYKRMFCSIGCNKFTRIQECRRNLNPGVGLRKSLE